MRTGIANVPLHTGHCPPWLFEKMKQLGSLIVEAVVLEYGPQEVLRRLADPVWFQSFGTVLGFDWHSSGLTTVVCGALKEGLKEMQGELGLFIAGGKGKASRNTPVEIQAAGEKYALGSHLAELQRTSRMVAKVDSAGVQDGYELYHHFFVFDREGNWTVVQQGMNEQLRYARRYHWLSETLTSYVQDPHRGICGIQSGAVLNLVSGENEATRRASVELCYERPEKIMKVVGKLMEFQRQTKEKVRQLEWFEEDRMSVKDLESKVVWMEMPKEHSIPSASYLNKILYRIYDQPPQNYEHLLETPGVGASTLRALAMVAEVTHGAAPSFRDPVRYAFAHGGKDGYPFFVQRKDLEHSLTVLRKSVEQAKMGDPDKLSLLRRLAKVENHLFQQS